MAGAANASRHKCLIYDGEPAEQFPVVVPLLKDGLAEGRRCLYLAGPKTLKLIRAALAAAGVDAAAEERRGALVLSDDQSHLVDGDFEPARMVALLRELVEAAVRDGFVGLWASGDMRWELGADRNFARLREYEALLEQEFDKMPLAGVCQYARDTVPGSAVADALSTHHGILTPDGPLPDNLFYVPPDLHLLGNGQEKLRASEWVWRQIRRVVKAEQERDESLKELRRLNAELELRVRERTTELEAFSYSVSHDLRAPVRHVKSFSDIIRRKHASGLSDEGRDLLSRVSSAADRMNGIIDGLLMLSKLSSRDLALTQVDLSAASAALIGELRAAEPDRRVEVAIAPGLRCRGDAELLGSALGNLLQNAWKYTARTEDARVEVGAGADGWFFVRDNGAGFDMSQADRLFQGFQRLHSPKEFPGHGLGLMIVRRIIERHGGRVRAAGEPGRGAVFSFIVD